MGPLYGRECDNPARQPRRVLLRPAGPHAGRLYLDGGFKYYSCFEYGHGSSGNRSNVLGNLLTDFSKSFISQNRPGDATSLWVRIWWRERLPAGLCRSTLAESRTTVDELYAWLFHGPLLKPIILHKN